MAQTAWQSARVTAITQQTATITSFRLTVSAPFEFLAGQHIVVRLTAPDGYTASRSYSIASAPDGSPECEIAVEALTDGEVSGYLHDVVVVGDELEIRGPIGGWFTWAGDTPALLVGGGSGLVPLLSMLRLARTRPDSAPAHLIVSCREPAALPFAAELAGPDVALVYTRSAPPESRRSPGRLTEADLDWAWNADATAYVCGSAGFASAASELLQQRGFPPGRIRLERFGPTS